MDAVHCIHLPYQESEELTVSRVSPMLEGRRVEPGVCPQCEYVQETPYHEFSLRCPSCDLPLRLVAGKFRTLRLLNAGNFAWIYQAINVVTQEPCAIKVVKPGLLDEVTEKLRFQREVQLTSLLGQKNEHIVRLYDDFGLADGLGHFYVMELLEGMSMDEILLDGVPLETPLSFHILEQLCLALDVVHQHGVIHRDLKPENIFLTERDGDPYFVKLIDFGIARHKNTNHRFLTQGVLGTPLYMSPEQCDSRPIDRRSDIYALGMLLYRCLTGTIPFVLSESELGSPRKQALGIMHAQITQAPRLMADACPSRVFPTALEQVIQQTLSKDREARQPHVMAFWQAIAPFVTSLP